MLVTARTVPAHAPKTQKGRTATVRPLMKALINSSTVNTTQLIRAQRLNAWCGVAGQRAELIADLLWGSVADE